MGTARRRLVGGKWISVVLAVVSLQGCQSTVITPTPTPTPTPPTSPGATALPTLSPSPSLSPVTAAGPSTQGLIADALAAGRIDYPTSLLYRAYAWLGDGRLPTEFFGASSEPDDGFLDAAVRLAQASPDSVPPALAALLLRPTDPASALHGPTGPSAVIGAGISAGITRVRPLTAVAQDPCGPDGWISSSDLTSQSTFKVWAACAGHSAADTELQIAAVLQYLGDVWDAETTDMRAPRSDVSGNDPAKYGGDGALDVYLVDPGQPCIRPRCRPIEEDPRYEILGATRSVPPNGTDGSTSAYILIPRAIVPTTPLGPNCKVRIALAHELFHSLQDAYNWDVQAVVSYDTPGHVAAVDYYWFVDASAEWAATHYVPSCAQAIYRSRLTHFQAMPDASLPALSGLHPYDSFIWPYFMQLKAGPRAVSGVWKSLPEMGTWDQFRDAINQVLPFEDFFREFAIANLDQRFKPGNVLDDDYWTPSPPADASFPEYIFPHYQNEPVGIEVEPLRPRRAGDPLPFDEVGIVPLQAHYYHFEPADVADPHAPTIGQIVFDFSKLTGLDGDLDIDFVVAIRDSSSPSGERWERRKLEAPPPASDGMPPHQYRFCRTLKSDLVDQIYLVLSDHQKDQTAEPITGSFTVQPLAEPCLFGDLTIRYDATSTGTGGSMNEEYALDLHVDMRYENGQWVAGGGSWSLSGTKTIDGPHTPATCWPAHITWSGQGTWLPPGQTGSGAEGEGVFTFFVGPDHVPGFNLLVEAHTASSDACTTYETTDPWTFVWPAGGCTLDDIAKVPCTEVVSGGPKPVAADDTGPYDLTGTSETTETAGASVNTINVSVRGIVGGSPSDGP